MRIAVFGSGGVGGYFGGRLAQAGHEVSFIARSRHLQAMPDHILADIGISRSEIDPAMRLGRTMFEIR